jgi:hypothetical protein
MVEREEKDYVSNRNRPSGRIKIAEEVSFKLKILCLKLFFILPLDLSIILIRLEPADMLQGQDGISSGSLKVRAK